LLFPVPFDQAAFYQPVDHSVNRWPGAVRSLHDCPAVYFTGISLRLEQNFKDIEGCVGNPLDTGHGAYIT
jgi:hypothetical protein